MSIYELRDPAEALRFLRQSLWLQRTTVPQAASVGVTLGWALELASAGEPVPPLGFVAEVGHLALGAGVLSVTNVALPGWPEGLVRAYEDCVLSKLAMDRSFERGADALRRYQGRDRGRALLFILQQMRQRAGFGGVLLNPALVKSLTHFEDLLRQGWQDLEQEGPLPLLVELLEGLITALRSCADLLGPEDIFELEHGTALAPLGERVALRQVVQAAAVLEAGLPQRAPRSATRRHAVATHLLAEDAYPVGGFASLSTRGSIESLLYSQLAYMDPADRPDLFDVKFLRDELLYYSRDENQFLRRRRTFVFAFYPDLVHTRIKDPGLSTQRLMMALALTVAAIRKLLDWLGGDALTFALAFVTDKEASPLTAEIALAELVLREPMAAGSVSVARMSVPELETYCAQQARRSRCQGLLLLTRYHALEPEGVTISKLWLGVARPVLQIADEEPAPLESDDTADFWRIALANLLHHWV